MEINDVLKKKHIRGETTAERKEQLTTSIRKERASEKKGGGIS